MPSVLEIIENIPALREIEPERFVACHFAEEFDFTRDHAAAPAGA